MLEKNGFLDISDNALSLLLRKPAPWDLLSIYKRDFYIKIHDWLTQNEEVQASSLKILNFGNANNTKFAPRSIEKVDQAKLNINN
jgi:hypothetical protein